MKLRRPTLFDLALICGLLAVCGMTLALIALGDAYRDLGNARDALADQAFLHQRELDAALALTDEQRAAYERFITAQQALDVCDLCD